MNPIFTQLLIHLTSIVLGTAMLSLLFYTFRIKEKIILNSFIIVFALTLFDVIGNFVLNLMISPLPTVVPIILLALTYLLNILVIKMLFSMKILNALMIGTIGFILLVVVDLVLISLF